MSLAVGIDLGTSYCSVGVFRNNTFEEIPNEEGEFLTPSVVAFDDTECLIGDQARRRLPMNPKNTIFNALRLNGLKFADSEVQADMRHFPFMVEDQDGEPVIQVEYNGRNKVLTTLEVMSMLLWKMKTIAEEYLQCVILGAVVTCPTSWKMSQRQSIRDAAEIAGLDILRIIDSSTCATLAYTNTLRNVSGERNVLIYDLGGSNFNVTLATIEEGIIEVKSVASDTRLGGEDFNNRLVNHFIGEFKRKYKKDLTVNARALCRLRVACEYAKRALSASHIATLEIDSLFDAIDFRSTITRVRFEELTQDLFRYTRNPMDRVLNDAKLDKSKVHAVVLIGGSTRIPKAQNIVFQYFDGKEPLKSVNPDLGPCYGASMQAAILAGDKSSKILNEIFLLDVQPLSLGVEIPGGLMFKMIPRNTSIPTKKSEYFVTSGAESNTEHRFDEDKRLIALPLSIYEGERQRVKDNNLLARIDIPYSSHQVEITLDIDANSILKVSVRDMDSRKVVKNITIRMSRISWEEMKRMQAERPQPPLNRPPCPPPLPPRPPRLNMILAKEYVEDEKSRKLARDEFSAQLSFFNFALKSLKLSKWLSLSDYDILNTEKDQMFEWMEENKNASSHDYTLQKIELVDLERRALDLVSKTS